MAERWIKPKEINYILDQYTIDRITFDKADERYRYAAHGSLNYWVQFVQELNSETSEPTGRILVQHTTGFHQNNIRYIDVWERREGGNPIFLFRNINNAPLSVYDENERLRKRIEILERVTPIKDRENRKQWIKYARELEDKVHAEREYSEKISRIYWNLLNEKDEAYVVSPAHQQLINEMEMEKLSVSTLRNLKSQLQKKYQDLIKENEKLQEKVDELEESGASAGRKHNERGAGRKPDLEKKQKMANAIRELREQGKKEKEITEILGISRATYYRYKKYQILNGEMI